MRRSLIAVFTLAALVVGTSVAVAGSKGTNRPFKGSSSGTTTATCDFTTGTCDSDTIGKHTSTHLGTAGYAIDSTQTWTDPTPETNGMDCAETVTGTVTLWAANGDALVGDIVHNDEAVCEVSLFEEYDAHFLVTVNGASSTGRYAGASGSYWLTGTSLDPTGPNGGPYTDTASFAGSLSY